MKYIVITHNAEGKASAALGNKISDGAIGIELNSEIRKIEDINLSDYDTEEYKDSQAAVQYKKDRKQKDPKYQPDGDQLDAIMKGFRAIIDEGTITLPQETIDWVEGCEAVKTAHPKPV